MRFSYQKEKFNVARCCLMLPHTNGDAHSIMEAFRECGHALHDFDRSLLDDDAQSWVRRLEEFMNTDGLSDPEEKGLWQVKAETLNHDEKIELSNIIDELAHWFARDD